MLEIKGVGSLRFDCPSNEPLFKKLEENLDEELWNVWATRDYTHIIISKKQQSDTSEQGNNSDSGVEAQTPATSAGNSTQNESQDGGAASVDKSTTLVFAFITLISTIFVYCK